jgi:capsid protein
MTEIVRLDRARRHVRRQASCTVGRADMFRVLCHRGRHVIIGARGDTSGAADRLVLREVSDRMSASLARFLKDFSAPPPVAASAAFELPSPGSMDFAFPAEPEVDLDELRREAHEEGRVQMRAELEEEHARELEGLAESHRQSLAAMTKAFESQMADTITAAVSGIAGELQQLLSAHVMDALLPLLDEQMAARAVESLAGAVRGVFADAGGIELVLRGPATMAERLGQQLSDLDIALKHIEAPGPDISVEHDDTILRTRLSAWRESVEELLK